MKDSFHCFNSSEMRCDPAFVMSTKAPDRLVRGFRPWPVSRSNANNIRASGANTNSWWPRNLSRKGKFPQFLYLEKETHDHRLDRVSNASIGVTFNSAPIQW